MQNTAYYPTNQHATATKKVAYVSSAAKSEITKKIMLFVTILACIVVAVNL